MLKWLLRFGPLSGVGDRFDGGTGGDLASLTKAMREEMDKKKGTEPINRLQDAFKQLKDMHRDDPRLAEGLSMMQSSGGASALDNAQWPFGPVGAPKVMASSVPTPQPRPPEAAAPVPMPMARPAEAPHGGALSEFFQRNAAMMKDPTTGEMIDPIAAAKFGGSGILNGLFG